MNRFKKLIISLTLLLGAVSGLNAQFRYGPIAGVDLTSLKFKQSLFTVERAVGPVAGIQAEMMFPGIGFGIDFGLEYQMRGAFLNLGERKIWASQGYGREHSMLHYLSIPLHLRFKWTKMDGFEEILAPFVFGGPEFGFLVAHNKIDALNYAGGEVGLAVGGGVELLQRWQVSFSHVWGVTYSLKTALLTDLTAQNRMWTVKIAYLF